MPSFTRGACQLHYDIHAGPPGASSVLFLHGLGSCADDWLLQQATLTNRFATLAPDLRGHGRSRGASGWPSMAEHARDVAALLSHLQLPPVHIVGLSLGGAVGLQLAMDVPSAVRSLTAVNAFARWRPGPRGRRRGLQRFLLALTGQMRLNARHIAGGLFPRDDQQLMRHAAELRIAENSSWDYFRNLVCVARFDVRRRLGEISCPVLVVAGDRDATVPRSAKLELAERIPQARWCVVANSGHATPIDAADEFNRLLLEFLNQVEVRTERAA
jgi:pimeloyl-ACP methyl ester carboxylesterase